MPTNAYPACAIDEYASIRLMLLWTTAVILPRNMVSTAMPYNACVDVSCRSLSTPDAWTDPVPTPTEARANVRMKTLQNAENAAAFDPVDRNAVTGVGAPS